MKILEIKDEFENEYENDFDLLFSIKKSLDLRTTPYQHKMEFTAQKAIDIVASEKLILSYLNHD